jgi:uncharacterized protein
MICPICKKPVSWKGNPFRPFCSSRCSTIDLGKWAMEKYAVTVERDERELPVESADGEINQSESE